MARGIVYIVFNRCHRHPETSKQLYKIGFTSNLSQRLTAFNSETGNPGSFEVYHSREVEDMSVAEQMMHYRFKEYRFHKEFFACDPGEAKLALDDIANKAVLENLKPEETSGVEYERYDRAQVKQLRLATKLVGFEQYESLRKQNEELGQRIVKEAVRIVRSIKFVGKNVAEATL